jgi:hypothetical protein
MPIEQRSNQFSHLRFSRVPDSSLSRRTRSFPPRRPPIPSDRVAHAQSIGIGFTKTNEQVSETRRRIGIDPGKLFVLSFDSINIDLRDTIERYQAWIVEEYSKQKQEDDKLYRCLVQFPTETSRQLFLDDLQLYQTDDVEQATLPPGMRSNVFNGLQTISRPSRDERMGARLVKEGIPNQDSFYIDVDFWHPPDAETTQDLWRQIMTLCHKLDGAVVEDIRTNSLLLAKIRANCKLTEALLDLDLVARVDLPPILPTAYKEILGSVPPPTLPMPLEDDPIVCVVDSGVVSGHPFLVNWVVEAHDFNTGEDTPVDLNGHGTGVAGLVVYGDVAKCIETKNWQPKVRICSAKVLRNNEYGDAAFPEERRAEIITEEAIRYFAQERQCKIFNLSLGISYEIYADGRQFAWAEKLDELARELDIVLVISAGNRSDPIIPDDAYTREAFQAAVKDNLLIDPEQRLCSPATAALAITVGAIARSDALSREDRDGGPQLRDAFAASPSECPAPFTRVGPGYNSNTNSPAIKPEFVDYGGNYALQGLAGGSPRWATHHLNLGEPTLCLDQNGRFLSTRTGTSFSAPRVAHAAAIAAASLKSAGQNPSANLVRALVGSAAELPRYPENWLIGEKDTLKVVGYGTCAVDTMMWSRQNIVKLVADDEIEVDKLHIYRVALPEVFLSTRGKRGITISLAYDPPVRASRREYLARTMTVEALRGLTTEEVEIYRAKQDDAGELSLPDTNKIDFHPAKTRLQWSTLQVCSKQWARSPKIVIPEGESEPIIHFVVQCQERFPDEDHIQRYGLVVTFWHESDNIQLYQALQNRVTLTAPRVRARV